MKAYMSVVAALLNEIRPASILDAPAGQGWLPPLLDFDAQVDGIDLYETRSPCYQQFIAIDLDQPFPKELVNYGAIVCCEGIEHLGNPLRFLKDTHNALSEGGSLIVTTPNTWYPGAKLKYLLNGFHPSFPPLIGKIKAGSHMHITPWSYPQLYTYLTLAGFKAIKLHEVPAEKKPKHMFEYILGWPQRTYCRRKARRSETLEQREFWTDAGSVQSTLGRRLVVSAQKLRCAR
jgi:SAM-dependent methyltransferase